MKNQLDHQKKYFNNIAITYHQNSEANIVQVLRFYNITKKYIYGNVLDIGSGGIIGYETKNAKTITIADIAPQTLKNPKHIRKNKLVPFKSNKLTSKTANVMKMPFKRMAFNTVIMVTTAHHLSILTKGGTKENIKKSFNEIDRVLSRNGIFILHECLLNPILKFIQEIIFTPSFYILQKFNKPLPYFMSNYQIETYLKEAGFTIIKTELVESGKKVYVPLFPFLSPPGWIWDIIQPSKTYICKKTNF